MKKLLFLVPIPLLLFSCDHEAQSKKDFQVNGKAYTITIVSSKDWSGGITGAPHASIIIPYADKTISNYVQLTNSDGVVVAVDELDEYGEELSQDKLDEIMKNITLVGSKDGSALLYQRVAGDSWAASMVIHQMGNGRMFWTGYYDSLANHIGFDINSVPNSDEVSIRFLSDTNYSVSLSALVNDALFSSKHPNTLDDLAIADYSLTENANDYVRTLIIDTLMKDPANGLQSKIISRIKTLSAQYVALMKDTVGERRDEDLFHKIDDLASISSYINLYPIIDSVLCDGVFNNALVMKHFLEDLNENLDSAGIAAVAPVFLRAFKMYHLSHKTATPSIAQDLLDVADYIEDDEMQKFAETELIRTWPQMVNDANDPNLLDSYFGVLTPAMQESVLFKAKYYMDPNFGYQKEAEQMISDHADCTTIESLKKTYQNCFAGFNPANCDSIPH